jgi:hypothetical protein
VYYVEQSVSFEAICEVGIAGLVGTIALQIEDNQGNVVVASSTAGIIESPANSGFYQATRSAPASLGQYSLVWSDDGSYTEEHTIVDDLVVVAAGSGDALPPLLPIGPGPQAQLGPCNAWTTVEDVAACCSADVGSDLDVFEEAASASSQVLFELTMRQWAGTCSQTVRPCQTQTPCGFQVLSRGHVVGYGWNGLDWGVACGCTPESKITLAGYPVREILEVKIDGVTLDPSEYDLKDHRSLVRMNGGVWPACQRIDLEDTDEGTWSVRYSYGQNPPWIGQMAARELACEIYKACDAELGLECALPSGVTSLTRQGVTIERNPFTAWGRQEGIWKTGLPYVDLFLNTYNPAGIRRRPVIVTPGRRTYPLSA